MPEIAAILGKTTRAIEMQVNKLKAEAVIGRVGPLPRVDIGRC